MTQVTPAGPASGIGELDAEAQQARIAYGADALIVCDRVVRIYSGDGLEVQALQGLDLLVEEGELTAVVGASGSGKSTLMNILAGLDTPTAGSVRVAGYDLGALSPRDRLGYRRAVIGFIWQQAVRNLLPYLTCRQNVLVPMRLARTARAERGRRADELLAAFGVAHCADRTPGELSGGEQQRIALATALANRPRVLLADEPTGELDTAAAASVFDALQTANTELGVTILLVSHDPAVADRVRRTVAIRDGRTSTELLRHDTTDDAGNAATSAVEYAVMDRAGRVQLPREMTRPLGMRERVRLESTPDHIGVWPDRVRDPEQPGSLAAAAAPPASIAAAPTSAAGSATTVRSRERAPLPPGDTVVAATDITRTFGTGDSAVQALRGVTFTIAAGQFAVLYGRSGSGKTTLLNIVGGLDQPTSGTLRVAGRDLAAASDRERTALRRDEVAFVFQSFGLIPMLSAAENIGIPLRVTATARDAREERVRMMLNVVGLDSHAAHRPNELSGGQQQRVAIARALAGQPRLLIADEPTGQLDHETGQQIIRLLRTVVRSEGLTALVATHDPSLADLADVVIRLEDGWLAEAGPQEAVPADPGDTDT
jgi:ABC-type lipoprotein export system ATPase subunit